MFNVVFGVARRDVWRLCAVVAVGSLLVLTFAWWWPAQRELDIGVYRYGNWDVESDIAAVPADVPRIERDFGAGQVMLGSRWLGVLASGGDQTDVQAIVVFPAAATVSYFPEAARVAYAPVEGANWIDLDTFAARRLGLAPGAMVSFGGPDPSSRRDFRVRGVYAVTSLGSSPLPSIVVSGAPLAGAFPSKVDGNESKPDLSVALVSGKSKDDVAKILRSQFYRTRFEVSGYGDDVSQESRSGKLAEVEEGRTVGVSLIQGISGLSALALLGIVVREVWVFSTRVGRRARVLRIVGAARGGLVMSMAALGGGAVASGLGLGAVLAYLVLNSGVIVTAFPPTLLAPYVGVTLGAMVVAAAIVAGLSWRVTDLRKPRS